MSNDTGVVKIRGKDYRTVALRLKMFREDGRWDNHRIVTDVLPDSGNHVRVQATIYNENGMQAATGTGEEERGSSNINQTSALENAETSAVGRALAFLHPDLAGTEIASADEVVNAMGNQATQAALEKVTAMCATLREHNVMDTVAAIQAHLAQMVNTLGPDSNMADLTPEDVELVRAAQELWAELSEAQQMALWVATTKGGIFTTQERYALKL